MAWVRDHAACRLCRAVLDSGAFAAGAARMDSAGAVPVTRCCEHAKPRRPRHFRALQQRAQALRLQSALAAARTGRRRTAGTRTGCRRVKDLEQKL